jgi:hypothetical protein
MQTESVLLDSKAWQLIAARGSGRIVILTNPDYVKEMRLRQMITAKGLNIQRITEAELEAARDTGIACDFTPDGMLSDDLIIVVMTNHNYSVRVAFKYNYGYH